MEKTSITMKRDVFVMYPLHTVLLNFSVKFRRNSIYNGQTLVGFLHIAYEVDYSTDYGVEDCNCSGKETFNETSELVPLKKFIAQTTVS